MPWQRSKTMLNAIFEQNSWGGEAERHRVILTCVHVFQGCSKKLAYALSAHVVRVSQQYQINFMSLSKCSTVMRRK